MSLVWHIVRKDLRRLGWPLAIWLALPALQWAFMGITINDALLTGAAFEGMTHWVKVMIWLHALVGFILAAWLVMEDGLVGTRSFWRTRPIGKTRLLSAKILGACLSFGVLPVMVMAPIWLQVGFSVRELEMSVFGLLLMNSLYVGGAVAIACVCETSGQFMVRMVGVIVLGSLAVGYCAGVFDGDKAYLANGVVETRYRIVLGVFMLTAFTLIVHQYLTLRRGRSHALLVAGVVLMFAVRWGWQWDLTPYFRQYPDQSDALAPQLEFTQDTKVSEARRKDEPMMVLGGKVAGVPAGSHLRLISGRGWRLEDGRHLPGARFHTWSETPLDRVTCEAAGFRGGGDIAVAWHAGGKERAEDMQQIRQTAAPYELSLEWRLMHGQVVGVLPLQVGAILKAAGTRSRIVGVERIEGRVIVQLEERDAHPPWSVHPEDSYVLVNQAGGLVAVPRGGAARELKFHWISLRQRHLRIDLPEGEAANPPDSATAWEKGVRLMKVRFSPGEKFTKLLPVTLPDSTTH